MARTPARKPKTPADPPTIAQLRDVRRKMWKRAGGTVEGLMDLAKSEAAKLKKPSRSPVARKRPHAA